MKKSIVLISTVALVTILGSSVSADTINGSKVLTNDGNIATTADGNTYGRSHNLWYDIINGGNIAYTLTPEAPAQLTPTPQIRNSSDYYVMQRVPKYIPVAPKLQEAPKPVEQKVPTPVQQAVPPVEQKTPTPVEQKTPNAVPQATPQQVPTPVKQETPKPVEQKVPNKVEDKKDNCKPDTSKHTTPSKPEISTPKNEVKVPIKTVTSTPKNEVKVPIKTVTSTLKTTVKVPAKSVSYSVPKTETVALPKATLPVTGDSTTSTELLVVMGSLVTLAGTGLIIAKMYKAK